MILRSHIRLLPGIKVGGGHAAVTVHPEKNRTRRRNRYGIGTQLVVQKNSMPAEVDVGCVLGNGAVIVA